MPIISNQSNNDQIEQLSVPDLEIVQKTSQECKDPWTTLSFGSLIPQFVDYARYDLRLSENTVNKYEDCLNFVAQDLPHIKSPADLSFTDITLLKKHTFERGAYESRVNSMIFALRKFLAYCRELQNIATINPKDIKPMKLAKRQVIFLTKEEVQMFLNSIKTNTVFGARMKALVSILLSSGMRISEALSLNKEDVDWERKEAVIIGKGNKERTVYFNDDALGWLRVYLFKRKDDNEALFVTFRSRHKRMRPYDLSKQFKHYAKKAGIKKKLTPHILRHTMATIMSINGADIRQIQLILGHSDIETTAKYYLGVDKEAVKQAHAKFLNYC